MSHTNDYRDHDLSYSMSVRTLSPPPRYQPVADDGAPSISQVISQSPPRESHMPPPPPPPHALPSPPTGPNGSASPPHRSHSAHGEKPTRLAWNPAEEGILPPRQYASSSRSSIGQDHSPTFDGTYPGAQQIAPSTSKMSYDSNANGHYDSNMHSRARSSYEPGPSNQHYYNGMPSSFPPPNKAEIISQRRESVGSHEAHLHASYTAHPNPSVISHSSANGGDRSFPPPQQQYPQNPSPTMPPPPPPRQHAPSISGYRSDTAVYYFRSCGHNSMILYSFENRPCYHIEVTMNCFMPSSYLTIIRRGSQQGEVIASFEMGMTTEKATLSFGAANYWLKDVFQNFRTAIRSNAKGRWIWKRDGYELEWSSPNDPESKAHLVSDSKKRTIAKIIPPSKPGQPRDTLLEVHFSVQHLLDDIVVSSIIVERKRQSPVNGTQNETLFN